MSKSSIVVILAALLLVVSPADTVWAQAQPPVATNPTRTETEILKTIVFITVKANEPGKPGKPDRPVTLRGTGFLVVVPDSRLGENHSLGFGYLVTNRHVAEAIQQDEHGNCKPLQIQTMYVTLNLKEPVNGNRSERVPIPLSQEVHWYFPKNEASDLAVLPFGIPDKYDVKKVLPEQFLTEERLGQLHVVAGDRVLTGGFYSGYVGLHAIQPILREGVLAMLPDGPMNTTMCKSGRLYLADVHIIPGNSGSPIFIIPALGLGTGVSLGGLSNVFGLLGVVSGYMYETSDFTLRASTTWKGSLNANSGISVVVPAQQLKDLLDSPELLRQRDQVATGGMTP
jgi:hypothetical protein